MARSIIDSGWNNTVMLNNPIAMTFPSLTDDTKLFETFCKNWNDDLSKLKRKDVVFFAAFNDRRKILSLEPVSFKISVYKHTRPIHPSTLMN